MKKLLFILGIAAGVLPATAAEVEYDGVTYEVYDQNGTGTACVKMFADKHYKGAVSVRPQVTYVGFDYDVVSIASSAFVNCGISSVDIPPTITAIWNDAFGSCRNLTSVILPAGLKSINAGAFSNTPLMSVDVPDNVESLQSGVFARCSSMKRATLGSGVTEISYQLFQGCANLETVVVRGPVEKVGTFAFDGCVSLRSLDFLPSTLESINSSAFVGCTSLESFTAPASLYAIGDNAFRRSGLREITLGDQVAFLGRNTFCDCRNLTSATLGDGISEIEEGVFSGCESLTSVSLGHGVTIIQRDAFAGCTSLVQIVIPASVETVSDQAFAGCRGLERLVLGDFADETMAKTHGGRAVSDSSLSLWNNSFSDCTAITEIYCAYSNPPEIGDYTFSAETYAGAVVYVPAGYKAVYSDKTGWSKFVHIEERDFSSVGAPGADPDNTVTVSYNLAGQPISENAAGVRLVVRGGTVSKEYR